LDCEKLMGLFINTLVLCTKTGDDPSFSDLLERVSKCYIGSLRKSGYSLPEISGGT